MQLGNDVCAGHVTLENFHNSLKQHLPFLGHILRVSTSAPMGDPDLYPQVYRLSKFKLRSRQVIEYR